MAHIIDITMDLSNRRELMEIIRAEFADWNKYEGNDPHTTYETIHGYVAEAHIGIPHGMVDNENLHLFRQYRNKVSADPAAMLAEAGFERPAELTEEEKLTLKLKSELRQLEDFEKACAEGYHEPHDEEYVADLFDYCEDWAYPARVSSIPLYRKAIKEGEL